MKRVGMYILQTPDHASCTSHCTILLKHPLDPPQCFPSFPGRHLVAKTSSIFSSDTCPLDSPQFPKLTFIVRWLLRLSDLFIDVFLPHRRGLLWWFSRKESACQCRRHRFHPWVWKIPWRRKWQLTPVVLPGWSHGQRSLVGYSLWDGKRAGQLSNSRIK